MPAPRKRRQRNTRPTKWDTGEFVAIDGEGFSEGPELVVTSPSSGARYRGKAHSYAYLAASDGSSIYSPGRLRLGECLEFLCGIVERNPRAVLVAFGASYDVAQMVFHDLGRADLLRMVGKAADFNSAKFEHGQWVYFLEYRPRKCLTVRRWRIGERRWERAGSDGRRKATPHLTVKLWDVWGFFQDSFAGVLKKWLPGDPDYEFIKRMKGERSTFDRSELADIQRYNQAELRCLVKVMDALRAAIGDLGLKISRWDGAGAIAAAMLQLNDVKAHKAELPEPVFHAARCAYSGGHIEACKLGHHQGPVWQYDVASAYPDQFRRLPSLAAGRWRKGKGKPPAGHTVVNCAWSFPWGAPFYPLFYREASGNILYPPTGEGWYWLPEFEAAEEFHRQFGGELQVLGWWHFEPEGGELVRPFGWIEPAYLQRQQFVAAAKRGQPGAGPEKVIKTGLNSLYGKTCQQVGWRIDPKSGELRLPPFFQLDWAGYVTAGCRGKLMKAALLRPNAVIAFATDGLFTTEPLPLECSTSKELGSWELVEHAGITNVMPGVYWLHQAEGGPKHYSRGFDKREMAEAEFVHEAWRTRRPDCPVELTRLIGIGSACANKTFWQMRGQFMTATRSLQLNGDNSKRYPIDVAKHRPHLGLVNTWPREHVLPELLGLKPEPSAPYPIAWLDGAIELDEAEGEMADEWEAMDADLA